jgi:hypothetical protein
MAFWCGFWLLLGADDHQQKRLQEAGPDANPIVGIEHEEKRCSRSSKQAASNTVLPPMTF